MRTYVKILQDQPQEPAKKNDVGYIDGYVRGGNDKPFAMVIIRDFISFVYIHDMEVISEEIYLKETKSK